MELFSLVSGAKTTLKARYLCVCIRYYVIMYPTL